ncbi:MAG: DNA repair protein RadA [Clostridia bacterium]|nr:DNA repair protein RadA [Clostridia bacterium]
MAEKTVYQCKECGYKASKWTGQCPMCHEWNTMEEQAYVPEIKASSKLLVTDYNNIAEKVSELELPNYMRSETGMQELDRVLGGGLVHGSVVLLSGEPGIGKSTLLLQISSSLGQTKKVLYVSGEESRGQLKLRAKRLNVDSDNLYVLTETDIDKIQSECKRLCPDILIVDSVQTIYDRRFPSAPGSITQVRECAIRFISIAKNEGLSVFLVGHVNKEGGIAGPKVLEHIVDTVLYFEGERRQVYRIIRAVKNRFGSTDEIGVFEMTGEGLDEVHNPSEALLAGRPQNVSGNCAVCVMEGTRPLIAEVQALVSQTAFAAPKRTTNGFDYNRIYLLLAVLEKRLGLRFSSNDVYINVIGGLRLIEPAADLGAALALISGIKDIPLPDDLVAIGEIGLAGECRAIPAVEQRINEAARIGFTKIMIPYRNTINKKLKVQNAEIIPVRSIYDAISILNKNK